MVPCPSLTVRTGFYYCSEISAHADCKALTYQLPLLADTHWKLTILTPPPAPTPPPYSRPCPHSTLRLPLHLSANNLLEPTMPFTHLCLPPQIELFDARRRHATTHTQTHTHPISPDNTAVCLLSVSSKGCAISQEYGREKVLHCCRYELSSHEYTCFLGRDHMGTIGVPKGTVLLCHYLTQSMLLSTWGTHATGSLAIFFLISYKVMAVVHRALPSTLLHNTCAHCPKPCPCPSPQATIYLSASLSALCKYTHQIWTNYFDIKNLASKY